MFDFDLTNGYVVLRIICGFFFIPHVIGKFTAQSASIGFFTAAGFKPPALFMYTAMVIEVILAPLLILGVSTEMVAWVSCAYLLVAGIAAIKVSKKWLWHIGGGEFPIFWAIACGALALLS